MRHVAFSLSFFLFFSLPPKGFLNCDVSRLFRSLEPLDAARAAVNCGMVSLNVSFSNGVMFVWLVIRLSFGDLPLGWLLSPDWVGVAFHPQGDGLGRLGFGVQQI